MTPEQLKSFPGPIQILDVRLADDFEALHIAGARNNCVYEVDFSKRLSDSAPDKSAMMLVYGANAESHEASAAFSKMLAEGYSDLHVLEGGVEAALVSGVETVSGKPLPSVPLLQDGIVEVDTGESSVQWTGRNLLNKHHGTVAISGGVMRFRDGELVTAEFALDMNKLSCTDLLADAGMHDALIGHLQSDDFFDVEKFPEAMVVITRVERIPGSKPGMPNLHLTAGLTIRDETHPIEFDAVSGLTPEGKPAAQAVFSIDRTRWGAIYGSGRFFHRLAGHLVNDLIDFGVKIVGKG